MKKTTLVAATLVTVFTTSSAFAWWGEGHRGEHGGKGGCKSEQREHRSKGMRGGAKFQEHMNRELSAAEIRTLQEARLIYMNNPNITVGDVVSTDKGYKVAIVTKENKSLVEEIEVAKNGMRLERFEAVQKRIEAKEARQKK